MMRRSRKSIPISPAVWADITGSPKANSANEGRPFDNEALKKEARGPLFISLSVDLYASCYLNILSIGALSGKLNIEINVVCGIGRIGYRIFKSQSYG